MASLVEAVAGLVEHSLGFVPSLKPAASHPKLRGRTLIEASTAFAGDDTKLIEILRPVTVAGADAAVDLDRFEAVNRSRLQQTQSRGVSGLSWSRDAPALRQTVSALLPGQPNPFGHLPALLAHFHHLHLPEARLAALGDVSALVHLSELNVSGNRLSDISDLPPRLESLHAYGNALTTFDSGRACASLVHCGLGFNRLVCAPPCFLQCRRLASLDLAHNDLCGLEDLLRVIEGLSELRHLFLAGNPCALEYLYPARVLAAVPGLASLDDELLTEAARDLLHAANTALLVSAHVLPPPAQGAPSAPVLRTRQLFRSVSFGDDVQFAVTLTEVRGLPQPADVYVLFGWPEGGPDRPQTSSIGTVPRAGAAAAGGAGGAGPAAAAAGGGGGGVGAHPPGLGRSASIIKGSVGIASTAVLAAPSPAHTYALRLRLPGAGLDVETPAFELGAQPPPAEALASPAAEPAAAAAAASGGGGRPSSAMSRAGAGEGSTAAKKPPAAAPGAAAKGGDTKGGVAAGGAAAAAKGLKSSSQPPPGAAVGGGGGSKAGGKGGAAASASGDDGQSDAHGEHPASMVQWRHRSVVGRPPSVALRDALECEPGRC
jgi:hypothetical protein